MKTISITIPLPPVTKKNSQRIITIKTSSGQTHKIIPSKKYEQYQAQAGLFIKHKGLQINAPCQVKCLFYMPTRRTVDLTNLLEAVDDTLVYYRVIVDDSYKVIESHDGSRVRFDKDNPRTEIEINLLESGAGA